MSAMDFLFNKLEARLSKARRHRPMRRAFAAAQSNNLLADWKTTQYTADQQIRFDLYALRSRARDLTLNDAYARRWMKLRRTNIIGPDGFSLQVRSGEYDFNGKFIQDAYANRIIEDRFCDWAKRENCSVDGRASFWDIQNLICDHLGRDGEFFVRKIRSKSFKYGFKLQVIEPDLVNERINQVSSENGYIIKMGVEVDEWRKPIAYCITKVTPGLEVYYVSQYSMNFERVLADEIYHGFDRERAFQTRGYPQMAAGMVRAKMLSGYEEAALVNARASAQKMGFLTSEEGEKYEGDAADSENNLIMEMEAGEIKQLPPGVKFESHDPKYPDAQHESFAKVILRGMAAAWGVAYESLANDFTGASYSSARTSLLNERDNWKREQRMLIESFLSPVFEDWLHEASLAGAFVNANGKSLPIESKFDKFNVPVWLGKRWDWVDPQNEVDAKLKLVTAGLTTVTDILAEQGKDITDVYSQLESEKELADLHNLNLSYGPNDGRTTPGVNGATNTPATGAVKNLLNNLDIPQNGKH